MTQVWIRIKDWITANPRTVAWSVVAIYALAGLVAGMWGWP